MLTRTDQAGWACYNRCIRGVPRTVWDGDQMLAEIRAPSAAPEQDVGPVPAGTDHPHGYGQVLYTHGPLLDHPIRVTRLSYDSVFAEPVWITPETNWRGTFDSGTIRSALDGSACRRVSSGVRDNEQTGDPTTPTGGEGSAGPAGSTLPDSITVCVQVDWPAPYQWKSKLEHGRGRIGPYAWMGSLIEGGRDLTGQLYMRNLWIGSVCEIELMARLPCYGNRRLGGEHGGSVALYAGAALSAGFEASSLNGAASAGNDIATGHPVQGLAATALIGIPAASPARVVEGELADSERR